MFLSSFLTTWLVSGTFIKDRQNERKLIASALDMANQEKTNKQQQRNKAYSNMYLWLVLELGSHTNLHNATDEINYIVY